MPTTRYKNRRLAARAAGRPAQLCITAIQGAGTAPVTLSPAGFWPRANRGDQIVSVTQDQYLGGSATVDRTKTANIAAGGSLTPGADVGNDNLRIAWYHFSG